MSANPMDLTVLPEPESSPRCSDYAADIALRPAGTALVVDEFLVVDVPRPWPKPVWNRPEWNFVPEAVSASGRRIRVLASEYADGQDRRVTHFWRPQSSGLWLQREYRPRAGEESALVEELIRSGPAGSEVDPVPANDGQPTVLICTQGSHDVCCGSEGSRLAHRLAEQRPDLDIRRVSHLGGHRFAPTAVTVPDGRMWGRVSVDDLEAVVDRRGGPARRLGACRGLIGLDPIAQVAELAVMAELNDWAVDRLVRVVETVEQSDGWECRVRIGDRQWKVPVRSGRIVPVITCRALGGLPVSTSTEYQALAPVAL